MEVKAENKQFEFTNNTPFRYLQTRICELEAQARVYPKNTVARAHFIIQLAPLYTELMDMWRKKEERS